MLRNFLESHILSLKTQGIILILCVLLSNTILAQSGSVLLWNFDGYCIDFTSGEPNVKTIGSEYDKTRWYVDTEGNLRLIFKDGIIYDDGFKEIKYDNYPIKCSFFVPVPGNSKIIYAIGYEGYFQIDLEKKEIISDVTKIVFINSFPLFVRHPNGTDIWMIHYDHSSIVKYLITAEGISYMGEQAIFDGMKSSDFLQISLSKDCGNFVATAQTPEFPYYPKYYYGTFDRSTATFTVTSTYSDPNVYRCISVGISQNNDRLIIVNNRRKENDAVYQMEEYHINNGIPDFTKYTVIPTPEKTIGTYLPGDILYGPDGKLYASLGGSLKEVGVIETDTDGKTKYTTIVKLNKLQRFFPSCPGTWFSEPQDPCITNPPTAQFNNAHVCYCDQSPLSIELSGTPPFTIEYTIDEKSEKVENITENHFNLSASGNYRLTKVSTLQCPQGGKIGAQAEAVIGKPLKKLIIKQQQ